MSSSDLQFYVVESALQERLKNAPDHIVRWFSDLGYNEYRRYLSGRIFDQIRRAITVYEKVESMDSGALFLKSLIDPTLWSALKDQMVQEKESKQRDSFLRMMYEGGADFEHYMSRLFVKNAAPVLEELLRIAPAKSTIWFNELGSESHSHSLNLKDSVTQDALRWALGQGALVWLSWQPEVLKQKDHFFPLIEKMIPFLYDKNAWNTQGVIEWTKAFRNGPALLLEQTELLHGADSISLLRQMERGRVMRADQGRSIKKMLQEYADFLTPFVFKKDVTFLSYMDIVKRTTGTKSAGIGEGNPFACALLDGTRICEWSVHRGVSSALCFQWMQLLSTALSTKNEEPAVGSYAYLLSDQSFAKHLSPDLAQRLSEQLLSVTCKMLECIQKESLAPEVKKNVLALVRTHPFYQQHHAHLLEQFQDLLAARHLLVQSPSVVQTFSFQMDLHGAYFALSQSDESWKKKGSKLGPSALSREMESALLAWTQAHGFGYLSHPLKECEFSKYLKNLGLKSVKKEGFIDVKTHGGHPIESIQITSNVLNDLALKEYVFTILEQLVALSLKQAPSVSYFESSAQKYLLGVHLDKQKDKRVARSKKNTNGSLVENQAQKLRSQAGSFEMGREDPEVVRAIRVQGPSRL